MGIRPVHVIVVALAGSCLGSILFPVFASAKYAAQTTTCMVTAKKLGAALNEYASDHDERFPPGKNWTVVAASYREYSVTFACPKVPTVPYAYAMHERAAGTALKDVDVPSQRVLAFESVAYLRNVVGDESLLPSPGRHNGASVASFVDGHVKRIRTGDFPAWPRKDPKETAP